jgi:ferredoxin-NADP reductase
VEIPGWSRDTKVIEATAAMPATPWQSATVVEVRDETPRAKTYRLALTEPQPHRPGQHYIVRLTAEDGYTAQRSYSVASAPDASGEIELTVEHLDGGEVSTFLHEVVEPGDELEVRGPIGGWFVWDGSSPALLVGGGSGVVPLMSMLRAARRDGSTDALRLLVSVRSPVDLFYAEEIPGPETSIAYSRLAPAGYPRVAGRLTVDDVAPLVRPDVTAFVCGSARFADAASRLVVEAGVPADRVRVERFGPTG